MNRSTKWFILKNFFLFCSFWLVFLRSWCLQRMVNNLGWFSVNIVATVLMLFCDRFFLQVLLLFPFFLLFPFSRGYFLCGYIYIYLLSKLVLRSPFRWDSGYSDCICCREEITPIKSASWYGTKLHPMVRLLFWRYSGYGVPLHCHYFQIHSDLEL